MTRSYVPLWDWFNDFERQARATNDDDRTRLITLHREAWNQRQKNPQHAYELCQQAVRLAQQLDEPFMELFHEYWATEMLLVYLIRVKEGLDLATKIVTKASQPRYIQAPIRGRAYITLISAYYSHDALGYQKEIGDMIDFMERDIPMDHDTHLRLQGYRVRQWMNLEDYKRAEEESLKYLAMSEGDIFREVDAYHLLTRITYYLGKEDKTLQYAALRTEKAKRLEDIQAMASGLMWQALILRKRNEEAEAQRLLTQAMVQVSGLGVERNREYYEALSRFYEAKKEYDKALAMRNDQLKRIEPLGDHYWTFDAHYKRCWLLKELNRLTEADVERAKAAANRLKDPQKYLDKLKDFEKMFEPNPVLVAVIRTVLQVKKFLGL